MHAGCVLCGLVASAQAAFASGSSDATASRTQGGSHAFDTSAVPSSRPEDQAVASASSSPVPQAYPYPQPFSPDPQSSFTGLGVSSTSGATMTKGNSRGVRVEGRDVIYGDEDITVYAAEGREALRQDGGHLIIVVNRHMESVNEMVSAGPRRDATWG